MSRDDLEFGPELVRQRPSWGGIARRIWYGPDRPSDCFPRLWGPVESISKHKFYISEKKYGLMSVAMLIIWLALMTISSKLVLFSDVVYSGPDMSFRSPTGQLIENLPVLEIACGLTDTVWSENCGMGGKDCLDAFEEGQFLVVKCPAFCDKGSLAFSPIIVQDRKIQYEPFLVKGQKESNYRADSFPCAVALKEGLITPNFGGVVGLQLQKGFTNEDGLKNSFPASFDIKRIDSKFIRGSQYDYRWNYIFMYIICMLITAFVVHENSVFFSFYTITAFLIIGLFFDPPMVVHYSKNSNSTWKLLSHVVGELTVALFLFKCLWDLVFVYMFDEDENQLVIRILLIFSIVCFNATIDRLPIDRLVWNDIKSMPGALFTLSCIAVIMLIGVFFQAWSIWHAGWLHKAAIGYLSLILVLILISFQSHLKIRLHHWVIGLILLPGCKTRSQLFSYIFAGLLLGLIINGIARWGFASIIETTAEVVRDKHTVPTQISSISLHDEIAKALGVEEGKEINWWFNDIKIARNSIDVKIPFESGYLRVARGSSRYIVAKIINKTIEKITEL